MDHARPPSPGDDDDDSDDDDDDDGGDATARTPPRTPAKGSFITKMLLSSPSHFAFQGGAKTPKKTPKSAAAERTPARSTRSSLLADDLPPADAFEFRPDVDAPLETPGRRMRPSPRATTASPASGARRPSSAVLEETPSPAKRARGAAASPAKLLRSSVSEIDFQDFKQKCAQLPRCLFSHA